MPWDKLIEAAIGLVLLLNTLISKRAQQNSRQAIVQAAIGRALAQTRAALKAKALKKETAMSHFLEIVNTVAAAGQGYPLDRKEKQSAIDAWLANEGTSYLEGS
jgi:hypothetical protein